ncbi:histidine phosphatase family protein [Mycobacterium angelicum]|uniref:Histidine phosphatase family protein n=1 Tax=Mycobacterium angelicum TaxID=470074 RepID=A0A1W9ZDD2_MYCAN|nr:histidine phosphatase family protein [Mycobacterium angelicum]MCV7199452.1 histidine phosphatase family protein [Mycobacterium angelicum]ORA12158.1 histidine phosphatase family protein [Mycobacterium angelicum]
MTEAMAAARFPADEQLSAIGLRQAAAARLTFRDNVAQLAGPERRARQTAELLGLNTISEPLLADLDCARWRGERLDGIDSDDLQAWLTDPAAAPHGGESIVALVDRVAGWLESLAGDTVAVTHPAVIRAAILIALGAPPESFWRIDIAPVGRTVMHQRAGGWTLRL